jgi:hypothetical protein
MCMTGYNYNVILIDSYSWSSHLLGFYSTIITGVIVVPIFIGV